jgi:hypothetical protein
MRRNFHYTVLGKSDFLSQDTGNARTSRAEILPGRIGERRSGEPVLKIGAGHAIPDFPTGDAFAPAPSATGTNGGGVSPYWPLMIMRSRKFSDTA